MEEHDPSNPLAIASRSDFHKAIHAAFERAAREGCREIVLCDPDFADWPLGERAVVASLTQWALAHRKLTVLAVHYDEILRRHPRWVDWRRTWGHVVECRAVEEMEAQDVPRVWFAPGLQAVRLIDPIRYRGVVDEGAADLVRIKEELDAISQRSAPAFASTLLGL